jgi:hypothetical protein
MWGQGCDEDPEPPAPGGIGAFLFGVPEPGVPGPGVVLGAVVLGVVVVGVVVVGVVVDVVLVAVVLVAAPPPLEAAEAPEIPASTPPAPSAPATITALILFARFIGLTSCSWGLPDYPSHGATGG